MLDPRELFEVEPDLPALDGVVLVQALDGFVDAGAAKRLAREHLLLGGSRVVARFDADQLHDYRARRPLMVFAEDHWESYADPQLAVHLVDDAAGTPFLVLAGPEPDVQWERFVAAVQLLVEQLGVRLTVGLNSIPMAVPHTRPVGVIGHGSRPELAGDGDRWVGTVQVPGTAGHLLEHRLAQAGRDSAGFAVAVPHYLADTEYPAASVVLLDSLASLTGLSLVTDDLVDSALRTRQALDAQIAESPEVAAVVSALEQQYDAFQAGRERSLLGSDGGNLPTADELGAELERFLAEQGRDEGPS
ncbi:MAG TPA: PAC2 family protein [Mycobacteriales bacterium]|nr:PAC2 family protein [Mycobacteriales bacterium]